MAWKLDGSDLDKWVERIGPLERPAGDRSSGASEIARIENLTGKPLAPELRAFLLAPVDLGQRHYGRDRHDPSLEHARSERQLPSWEAELPDVESWLDRIAAGGDESSPFRDATEVLLASQFHGLYPLGFKDPSIENRTFIYAVLDPPEPRFSGLVQYIQNKLMMPLGDGTISSALYQEWLEFLDVSDGDDDDFSDWLPFVEGIRDREDIPDAGELPDDFVRRWNKLVDERAYQTFPWFAFYVANGDDFANINLASLPTAAQWQAHKARVALTHHDAMHWLMTHVVLRDEAALAEALVLARTNPSPLVRDVVANIARHRTTLLAKFQPHVKRLHQLGPRALRR